MAVDLSPARFRNVLRSRRRRRDARRSRRPLEPVWSSVEAWAAIVPTKEWQTAEADLTPYVRKPGEYIVEIIKRDGDAELETELATLLIAGTEAQRLVTPLDRPSAWRVLRTDQVVAGEKSRTALRLSTRLAGGGAWRGEMRIRNGP